MTKYSGELKSNSRTQTIAVLNDTPEHQLLLSVNNGQIHTDDNNFDGLRHNSWGTGELHRGSGQERGYFRQDHANGDHCTGSYECNLTTVNNQPTMQGTWKYTGGTGRYEGISGEGTFKGRQTSPNDVEISFEGSYQLKAIKAA